MRRQLPGWLTLFPVVLIAIPIGAIPLADRIIRGDNIITYHRMFFAVPAGLAVIGLLRELALRRQKITRRQGLEEPSNQHWGAPMFDQFRTLPRSPLHSTLCAFRSALPAPFLWILAGLVAFTVVPLASLGLIGLGKGPIACCNEKILKSV